MDSRSQGRFTVPILQPFTLGLPGRLVVRKEFRDWIPEAAIDYLVWACCGLVDSRRYSPLNWESEFARNASRRRLASLFFPQKQLKICTGAAQLTPRFFAG